MIGWCPELAETLAAVPSSIAASIAPGSTLGTAKELAQQVKNDRGRLLSVVGCQRAAPDLVWSLTRKRMLWVVIVSMVVWSIHRRMALIAGDIAQAS